MTMNDTFKKFEETLLLNCIANPSYAKKLANIYIKQDFKKLKQNQGFIKVHIKFLLIFNLLNSSLFMVSLIIFLMVPMYQEICLTIVAFNTTLIMLKATGLLDSFMSRYKRKSG